MGLSERADCNAAAARQRPAPMHPSAVGTTWTGLDQLRGLAPVAFDFAPGERHRPQDYCRSAGTQPGCSPGKLRGNFTCPEAGCGIGTLVRFQRFEIKSIPGRLRQTRQELMRRGLQVTETIERETGLELATPSLVQRM